MDWERAGRGADVDLQWQLPASGACKEDRLEAYAPVFLPALRAQAGAAYRNLLGCTHPKASAILCSNGQPCTAALRQACLAHARPHPERTSRPTYHPLSPLLPHSPPACRTPRVPTAPRRSCGTSQRRSDGPSQPSTGGGLRCAAPPQGAAPINAAPPGCPLRRRLARLTGTHHGSHNYFLPAKSHYYFLNGLTGSSADIERKFKVMCRQVL